MPDFGLGLGNGNGNSERLVRRHTAQAEWWPAVRRRIASLTSPERRAAEGLYGDSVGRKGPEERGAGRTVQVIDGLVERQGVGRPMVGVMQGEFGA